MRPTNPYAAVQGRTKSGRTPPTPIDAPPPPWEPVLNEFRHLGQAHQGVRRGLSRSLDAVEGTLATVCRKTVTAVATLSDCDRRDLVRAARAEGLIERGTTDAVRVLTCIGCGPDVNGSVVSRVAALSRLAIERQLDLDVELKGGFWAAHSRLLPPHRPRRNTHGPIQVRISLPASASERLDQGETLPVHLTRRNHRVVAAEEACAPLICSACLRQVGHG